MKPMFIKDTDKTEFNIPIGTYTDFLTKDELIAAQTHCLDYLKVLETSNDSFKRKAIHNPPFFVRLHHRYLARAKEVFGLNIKPSYCYLSLYEEGGYCPPHYDREQCVYSFDLCIHQTSTWPIYVKNKPYILETNQALCYSGTHHLHYRKEKLKEQEYCFLAFFHFVPIDFAGNLN